MPPPLPNLQVKIIRLQLLETLVKRRRYIVDTLGNFVGDEKLLTGDIGFLDRNANFLFSAIHLCTVQMIEALLNCFFDQFNKTRIEVCLAITLEPCYSRPESEQYSLSVPQCSHSRLFIELRPTRGIILPSGRDNNRILMLRFGQDVFTEVNLCRRRQVVMRRSVFNYSWLNSIKVKGCKVCYCSIFLADMKR